MKKLKNIFHRKHEALGNHKSPSQSIEDTPVVKKPIVGISSCLLGENVRYDGRNKQQKSIANFLPAWLELVGFCPEMSAGLGTPRPPIQLVQVDEKIQAVGVNNHSINVTEKLKTASNRFIVSTGNINGYIFKARSPSCGYKTTPLYNNQNDQVSTINGIFSEIFYHACPSRLLVDESFFTSHEKCLVFVFFCYALAEAKIIMAEEVSVSPRNTKFKKNTKIKKFLKHYQWLWQLAFSEQGTAKYLENLQEKNAINIVLKAFAMIENHPEKIRRISSLIFE